MNEVGNWNSQSFFDLFCPHTGFNNKVTSLAAAELAVVYSRVNEKRLTR